MILEDKTYTRLELESTVRLQYPDQDSLARYAVSDLKLDKNLFSIVPYIVLLHWVLDMITDAAKKSGVPKITSIVKMGLTPPRKSAAVKILGFTKLGDDIFMNSFTMKLASMINSKNATVPGEYEGLDLASLQRYLTGATPITEVTLAPEKKTKKTTTVKDLEEVAAKIESLVNRVTRLEAQIEAHAELLSK